MTLALFRYSRCLCRSFVAAGSLSFFILGGGHAAAQAQPQIAIAKPFTFGSSECPAPDAVERELVSLVPPERRALLEQGVRIDVEDLGESYRVAVSNGSTSVQKSYSDPARDCVGRARFAAVFAVLTLMPPELGPDLQTAPPPPAPTPPHVVPPTQPVHAPPPQPSLARAQLVHLELGALFGYAPAFAAAPELTTFGGELRVAFGRATLASTLSVAYTTRARFELDGVHGDVAQLPVAAGVRLRSDLGAWSLAADLGLLAVLQRVRGADLFASRSQSSLELGARAGLLAQPRLSHHLAPFLGAFVELVPAPRDVLAEPEGVVGNLPYFWVGGTVGVSLGL